MADFRGPVSVDSGARNDGWHKSPTMYAGGWINAWRDNYGTIHYQVNARSAVRSGSSYGYNVTVQILYRGYLVHEWIPSGRGNFNETTGELTFTDNNDGFFQVRYICGQTGGCTQGYGTVYMVGTDSGADGLVWLPSWSATAPGTPGNQRVNGGTNINIYERTDLLTLTWDEPSGGTYGVAGYRIYYSVGQGWQYLGTTSDRVFYTRLSDFYNNFPRGGTIGFQITAYSSAGESGVASGAFDNNRVNLVYMSIAANATNVGLTSATINWASNLNIQKVEWKVSTETNWKVVSSGLYTTSGNFQATGLPYNKSQTIQVRLTSAVAGEITSTYISLTTLDIARITKCDAEWSVEDPTTLTISNPANVALQLYLSYNNIELISRNNLTLTNGTYTLTLTESEKNILYTQAASDANPSFKFILKSFSGGTKMGEDTKNTKVTFPTKAWVKVNNTWKRALVWTKIGTTWKQCIPWVKVGATWKRT
jgi:hypothetical protein